jgi:hypothetical protein
LWNEQILVPGKLTIQVAPRAERLIARVDIPYIIIHADLQQSIDELFERNLNVQVSSKIFAL